MITRVPGMRLLLATALVSYTGFSLLLPISPLWAVEGGADELGAGLVTTVLMATTIATQLVVGRLLSWLGWGRVFALGLIMLGAPALLQAIAPDLWLVMLTSAARGVGFGIITVCGATATSVLVPPTQLGRAIGLYGLATALPQLAWMPAAPALVDLIGIQLTIALGAAPLLGLAWVAPLGRDITRAVEAVEATGPAGDADPASAAAVLRRILLPISTLVVITAGGGALMTFAPQLVGDTAASVVALFAMMAMSTLARWRVGALADRWGTRRMLWPLMAFGALGLLLVAGATWQGQSVVAGWLLLTVGALFVGLAYGGLQTATLARTFADAGAPHRHRASVAWNVCFDLGTALGAAVAGAIAQSLTFAIAFVVLAAIASASATTLAVADTRHAHPADRDGGHPARR